MPIIADHLEPNDSFDQAIPVQLDAEASKKGFLFEGLTLHTQGDADYFRFKYDPSAVPLFGANLEDFRGRITLGIVVRIVSPKLQIGAHEEYGGCTQIEVYDTHRKKCAAAYGICKIPNPQNMFPENEVLFCVKNPSFEHQGPLRYRLGGGLSGGIIELSGGALVMPPYMEKWWLWGEEVMGGFLHVPVPQQRYEIYFDPSVGDINAQLMEFVSRLDTLTSRVISEIELPSHIDRVSIEPDTKNDLGNIAVNLGIPNTAINYYINSADMFRELVMPEGERKALQALHTLYVNLGKPMEAEQVSDRIRHIG